MVGLLVPGVEGALGLVVRGVVETAAGLGANVDRGIGVGGGGLGGVDNTGGGRAPSTKEA